MPFSVPEPKIEWPMNRGQIAPVVELALNVYNFTQLIEQFVDERVEEVEDFVDALREDSEPLDALILFVEMILDENNYIQSF